MHSSNVRLQPSLCAPAGPAAEALNGHDDVPAADGLDGVVQQRLVRVGKPGVRQVLQFDGAAQQRLQARLLGAQVEADGAHQPLLGAGGLGRGGAPPRDHLPGVWAPTGLACLRRNAIAVRARDRFAALSVRCTARAPRRQLGGWGRQTVPLRLPERGTQQAQAPSRQCREHECR